MAAPNAFLLFVLFLFFHFSFFMSFTTNAASKLINDVCSRTRNRNFCVQTLTNDGGDNISTMTGLQRHSLVATRFTAHENYDFVDHSSADPRIKQVLQHCKINYAGSIAAIELAFGNLDAGQYHELNVNTNIAQENSNDCDRVIKQGPPPPGLQEKNNKMLQLTDISVTIAGLLSSP